MEFFKSESHRKPLHLISELDQEKIAQSEQLDVFKGAATEVQGDVFLPQGAGEYRQLVEIAAEDPLHVGAISANRCSDHNRAEAQSRITSQSTLQE